MMRLIAKCQLTGDYGSVNEGDQIDVPDEVGRHLLANGHAVPADPPRKLYEAKALQPETPSRTYQTKVIVPQTPPRAIETKQQSEASPDAPAEGSLPFRDMPLPDEEPADVAPAGHPLLSGAELPEGETGIIDRRGRRRRAGSSPE